MGKFLIVKLVRYKYHENVQWKYSITNENNKRIILIKYNTNYTIFLLNLITFEKMKILLKCNRLIRLYNNNYANWFINLQNPKKIVVSVRSTHNNSKDAMTVVILLYKFKKNCYTK